ncbi:DUF1642 domain-containing protein [Streptococcus pluranimalium]|uniref:DUF1642 domain-containing protein n=1 Tax=Streptococcus pluranimalium TaxID=82348 RepID=UPI003F691CE2
MNKQEAIKTIKHIDTLTINDRIVGQQVDMVIKNQVLDIINQIDEQQKPVIQQFVADWIEKNKSDINTLYNAYTLRGQRKNDVSLWVNSNQDTFARAWLFGYEVEKEKLYTVEIPNPNGIKLCLAKKYDGIGISKAFGARWRGLSCYQLTESEIKKDFEWAWQEKFAKEVEG